MPDSAAETIQRLAEGPRSGSAHQKLIASRGRHQSSHHGDQMVDVEWLLQVIDRADLPGKLGGAVRRGHRDDPRVLAVGRVESGGDGYSVQNR